MSKPPITSVKNSRIASLEHDGVVKISGLLSEDWVARMQRAVDDVLAGPSSRGAELKSDGTPGRFAYDNYLFAFNEDFRAMAFESPAAEVAAQIMGASRINVVFDFILVKEPNTPAETVWHQDISANPCEGSQVCGMWISLDEVTGRKRCRRMGAWVASLGATVRGNDHRRSGQAHLSHRASKPQGWGCRCN